MGLIKEYLEAISSDERKSISSVEKEAEIERVQLQVKRLIQYEVFDGQEIMKILHKEERKKRYTFGVFDNVQYPISIEKIYSDEQISLINSERERLLLQPSSMLNFHVEFFSDEEDE